ncbi:MAG: hypothetical protein LBO78_03240 [Rickettsiales bacterium]|jgi:hypothetical protein|nr:hypothetical protein [Rickettsiales bacterium]
MAKVCKRVTGIAHGAGFRGTTIAFNDDLASVVGSLHVHVYIPLGRGKKKDVGSVKVNPADYRLYCDPRTGRRSCSRVDNAKLPTLAEQVINRLRAGLLMLEY